MEEKAHLVWTEGDRVIRFLSYSPVLLSKMRAHLPVYIHWSVGWPDKSGRNFQHRTHPHLLLSSDGYNQENQKVILLVQCFSEKSAS